MVDMAHFAGLVAAELFPSPLPHAHVVTTTRTRPCAARARHGLTNDLDIARRSTPLSPGPARRSVDACDRRKAAAFGEALRRSSRSTKTVQTTPPCDTLKEKGWISSAAAPTAT